VIQAYGEVIKMNMKKGAGEKVFNFVNIAVLTIISAVMLYPMLYVLLASLSNSADLAMHKGLLFHPIGISLSAYVYVFKNPAILLSYRNTLIYVFGGTTVNIILTAFGAYGLSRKNVKLKTPIMFMIVFTMFFYGGLIPTYLLVKNLGLINNMLAMILPSAVSAYYLMLMRTSFQSIPDSLIESAKIDGSNDFGILFKVAIPISLPILVVMLIFYGVANWNAYFNALIFITARKLYPLQMILREILLESNVSSMVAQQTDNFAIAETIKYAAIMVATLPILFIYPFLQKYFVSSIILGAIKE
jgi:ABC-type sugar transport system, permease component